AIANRHSAIQSPFGNPLADIQSTIRQSTLCSLQSPMARYVVRLAKSAGLIILFLVAAILGNVSGVLFAFSGDLPQISALDDYAPSTITRVYGSHGEPIGEFSTQRRVVVS